MTKKLEILSKMMKPYIDRLIKLEYVNAYNPEVMGLFDDHLFPEGVDLVKSLGLDHNSNEDMFVFLSSYALCISDVIECECTEVNKDKLASITEKILTVKAIPNLAIIGQLAILGEDFIKGDMNEQS